MGLTAKTHINRAMTKLHARDRAQLVVLAYESGPHTTPDIHGPCGDRRYGVAGLWMTASR